MRTTELLTPKDVAERLDVRTETVYRVIRSGRLAHFRFGRQLRISEQQLRDYTLREATDPLDA